MKTGVLLLGHGSRREAANRGLEKLAGLVRAGLRMQVQPAFFQFGKPSLPEMTARFVQDGVDKIIVVPAFLFPGIHLEHDLPNAIKQIELDYGGKLQFVLTSGLGPDPRLAEILIERVCSANCFSFDEASCTIDFDTDNLLTNPEQITARSRRLIEESPGWDFFMQRFSGTEGEIVRRVIHATGSPGVAPLMRFHPQALAVGLAAVRRGALLFTDVRMVKIGINRSALQRSGGKAVCMIRHPRVQERARTSGETRAMVAVREFRELWRGQLVVIGNAPTALAEVLAQSRMGIKPALIIGTPVGFVGAAEVKARLANQDVPYITLLGNQGGSTAAVAIVNALLALAQGGAGL